MLCARTGPVRRVRHMRGADGRSRQLRVRPAATSPAAKTASAPAARQVCIADDAVRHHQAGAAEPGVRWHRADATTTLPAQARWPSLRDGQCRPACPVTASMGAYAETSRRRMAAVPPASARHHRPGPRSPSAPGPGRTIVTAQPRARGRGVPPAPMKPPPIHQRPRAPAAKLILQRGREFREASGAGIRRRTLGRQGDGAAPPRSRSRGRRRARVAAASSTRRVSARAPGRRASRSSIRRPAPPAR